MLMDDIFAVLISCSIGQKILLAIIYGFKLVIFIAILCYSGAGILSYQFTGKR